MLDILSGRKITFPRCVMAALHVSISISGNFAKSEMEHQLLRNLPSPSIPFQFVFPITSSR